ncbi:MAG TPA: sigma-70 family RNA polymerase sigma factor [Solirubrobacteraceae bacterium]
MAPTGSTQVRHRPWWRSSRRGGAPGRCPPRDRGRGGGAAADLALVLRAQRGGPREREALVNAYQPMIASVAHAYRRSTSVDREELTQEGVVGLLRALERYEPERGVPFWGYAAWWVRQAMQQVVSELSRPMVLSDRALRQLARIKEAQRRFEQARRREATTAELSTIVGMPQSQVGKLLCTERTARGLDEPTGAEAGQGTTVGELLADPPAREAYERVPQQVLAAQVPALLGHLSDRERTVICSRYGLGEREQTLREIALRVGVSAERVRQIEQESLAKLHAAVAPDPPGQPPEGTPPDASACAPRALA